MNYLQLCLCSSYSHYKIFYCFDHQRLMVLIYTTTQKFLSIDSDPDLTLHFNVIQFRLWTVYLPKKMYLFMHCYGNVATTLLSLVNHSNCFHHTLQTLTNQKGEENALPT